MTAIDISPNYEIREIWDMVTTEIPGGFKTELTSNKGEEEVILVTSDPTSDSFKVTMYGSISNEIITFGGSCQETCEDICAPLFGTSCSVACGIICVAMGFVTGPGAVLCLIACGLGCGTETVYACDFICELICEL